MIERAEQRARSDSTEFLRQIDDLRAIGREKAEEALRAERKLFVLLEDIGEIFPGMRDVRTGNSEIGYRVTDTDRIHRVAEWLRSQNKGETYEKTVADWRRGA
jgi:hypothetical protein